MKKQTASHDNFARTFDTKATAEVESAAKTLGAKYQELWAYQLCFPEDCDA